MRLGFTGSRYGMSPEQKATFWKLINLYKPDLKLFTHGDCVGADVEAAAIVHQMCPDLLIECRPGLNSKMRGFGPATFEHPAKAYKERDREIVLNSTHMIATPFTKEETGGTWYTAKFAMKKKVPIIMIWRTGQYEIKHGLDIR